MRVVEKRVSSKIVLEERKAILHQGHREIRWPTGRWANRFLEDWSDERALYYGSQ
jgi:hypothetical protein